MPVVTTCYAYWLNTHTDLVVRRTWVNQFLRRHKDCVLWKTKCWSSMVDNAIKSAKIQHWCTSMASFVKCLWHLSVQNMWYAFVWICKTIVHLACTFLDLAMSICEGSCKVCDNLILWNGRQHLYICFTALSGIDNFEWQFRRSVAAWFYL